MAIDLTTGAAAAAAAPHPQDLPPMAPAVSPDFTQTLDQAAPQAQRAQEAAPANQYVQTLAQSRTDSLGHQVLDSLERFGSHMQELQKLGARPVRPTPQLPSGPGALLNPVMNTASIPRDGGPKDPVSATDKLGAQYDAIFDESMARQAKLFGLVIEVDLGRTVASTSTSTAKTLLTQSG